MSVERLPSPKTTSNNAEKSSNFSRELRSLMKKYPQIRNSYKELKQTYKSLNSDQEIKNFLKTNLPEGLGFITQKSEANRERNFNNEYAQKLMEKGLLEPEDVDLIYYNYNNKETIENKTEKLLQNYMINVMDSGLSSIKEMTDPETGEHLQEDGIAMLSRAGFFYKIQQQILDKDGEYNGKPITILNADITKLRNSDMVKDILNPKNPSTYADILLQKTARAFKDIVENLNEFVEIPLGTKIELGRYGGDEFVFSIVGEISSHSLSRIKTLICKRIELIEAYYMDEETQKIVRKPAGIKNNEIEEFQVPKDPQHQDIFVHYLKQGLVFNNEQIESFRDRFRNKKGELIHEKLIEFLNEDKKYNNIYAQENPLITEKIEFLLNQYHEDGLIAMKAYLYDQTHGTNTAEEIISILEYVLYDSLLRARVYDFNKFKSNLNNGNYSNVWGYDMKFIKEINDNISYADADLGIRSLWTEIKSSIPEKDRQYFDFARRGGTFFISLKKGKAHLVSNTAYVALNTLKNITVLKSVQNPNGIKIPIGKSIITPQIEKASSNPDNTFIRTTMNGLFESMDIDSYNSMLLTLSMIDLNENKNRDSKQIQDLEDLVFKFFTGKRKDERINKLILMINQGQTIYKETHEKTQIIEQVHKLKNYTDKSKVDETIIKQHFLKQNEKVTKIEFSFDFNTLSHYKDYSFEALPSHIQILGLLTFEHGPKTLEEFYTCLSHIESYENIKIFLDSLPITLSNYLAGEEKTEYSLSNEVKTIIRNKLKFTKFDKNFQKLMFRSLNNKTNIETKDNDSTLTKNINDDFDNFDFRNT
jgi:GGDEF domain-containing protein